MLQVKNLKLKIKNSVGGFTLMELVLTLSLFLLLASAGIGAYFQYYNNSLNNIDIENTLTFLKHTQFKALKNATSSDYGVYFNTSNNTITTFKETYTQGASENVILNLVKLDIISFSLSPDIGYTNEIVFKAKSGKTDNVGSFMLGKSGFTHTFTINSQGIAN